MEEKKKGKKKREEKEGNGREERGYKKYTIRVMMAVTFSFRLLNFFFVFSSLRVLS